MIEPERIIPEDEFPAVIDGIPERLDWGRLQIALQLAAPISERQPAREIAYDFPPRFDADGYMAFTVLDMFGAQTLVRVHWRQLVPGLPMDPS